LDAGVVTAAALTFFSNESFLAYYFLPVSSPLRTPQVPSGGQMTATKKPILANEIEVGSH
jgi:hypothetical protein